MAGFLYYKPGDAATPAWLKSVEFPHANTVGLPGRGCTQGPDGQPGFCFTMDVPPHPNGRAPMLGYFPEKQTWRSYVGGKLWLGWETANKPTPVDLQRRVVAGHPVTLRDGNVWTIPPLIFADGKPNFETVIDWNDHGHMRERVGDEHLRLFELVQEFGEHSERFEDETRQDDLYDVVAHAIARNYRLSLWECGPLGILDTQGLARVLAAIIDCETPDVISV